MDLNCIDRGGLLCCDGYAAVPIRLKLHHINDSGSLKTFCAENKLQPNEDAFYLR